MSVIPQLKKKYNSYGAIRVPGLNLVSATPIIMAQIFPLC